MAPQKHLLLIFTIAGKILLPHVRFKFYTHNTNTLLEKEAAEKAKNQFLLPILDPRSSVSELFSSFSSLIKISSIMIEIQREVDQNQKISEVLKGSQISNQKWYSFFYSY
jgi:alcohol dehydrogenase class IV